MPVRSSPFREDDTVSGELLKRRHRACEQHAWRCSCQLHISDSMGSLDSALSSLGSPSTSCGWNLIVPVRWDRRGCRGAAGGGTGGDFFSKSASSAMGTASSTSTAAPGLVNGLRIRRWPAFDGFVMLGRAFNDPSCIDASSAWDLDGASWNATRGTRKGTSSLGLK